MNKELEQFFTPHDICNLLISCVSLKSPQVAIDVGFGEGALLQAVQSKWRGARLLGVDVDKRLIGSASPNLSIERVLADGLDHGLPSTIEAICGGVDLAVNNPPYKSIVRNRSTDIILQEAGLLASVGKSKNYPAEIVFLAQNLRILSNNGTLAIIIPSGIINNDRWSTLRKEIVFSHGISKVVELPANAFRNTEAKTFLLIMRKGSKTKKISLFSATENGRLSRPISINPEQACNRMDWSHYNIQQRKMTAPSKSIPNFTLGEIGAEVFRGQISSSEASRMKIKPFHTVDMPLSPKKVKIGKYLGKESYRTTKTNDILISRVGSRCLGRICLVEEGERIVTDCIYVIRINQDGLRDLVWKRISNKRFQSELLEIARGVCAQYITKQQLLDIKLLD